MALLLTPLSVRTFAYFSENQNQYCFIDIGTEKGLEQLILESKNQGYTTSTQLHEDYTPHSLNIDDIIKSVICDRAKSKLISYDLIKVDTSRQGIYPLTEKGVHFESFEKCREIYWLEQEKLKYDVEAVRNAVLDNPKLRREARIAMICAVASVVVIAAIALTIGR